MSFLNLKSLLPQRSPSPDRPINQQHALSNTSSKLSPSMMDSLPEEALQISMDNSFADTSLPYLPVIKCQDPVRIFICDRRRAILEKIVEPRTLQDKAKIEDATEVFIDEKYADKSQPSWAFKFDFSMWNHEYNIEEACFRNFCSFLDRDHGKMAMEAGVGRVDSQSSGNSAQNSMLTPPWSNDSRSPSGDSSAVGSPPEHGTAYHRLPSSQAKNTDQQYQLDAEAISNLKSLSGGRLERLAHALEPLNLSHIVFRDHSCYTHRPTLLLFWFLSILRNRISRLTFDSIQSDSRIPLDKVLDFDGLIELNFIQSKQRSAFSVTSELLLKWLHMSEYSERCRLKMTLSGCTELTPRGISQFLKEWRSTSEPLLFDSITIDVSSVSVADFVHEMEHPTGEHNSSNDWRPPTPPTNSVYGIPSSSSIQSSQSKQFVFKHRKGTAHIHYKYANGRLVFTCNSGAPLPCSPIPRASSAQCFGQHSHRSFSSRGNSLHRNPTYSAPLSDMKHMDHGSQNSLVNKMMGFFIRSNA